MHRLQELVRLHRLGRGAGQTAKLLKMDRKTERKYRTRLAKAGLLEGPADQVPELEVLREAVTRTTPRPPQERSSVQRWADFIEAKRKAGLGPTAIHALLQEQCSDFTGSLPAVKRLYRALKNAGGPRAGDVAIPIHTAAGQQAQVDFGYVGLVKDPKTGKRRKAWVFVMVLSHSRLIFARVVFRQDLDTWLELHRLAFVAFGGVPAVIVPDNLKAAVIKAAFAADEMGAINRSYRELARHYGFVIDPTPAYSPEKKGKVESAVKYVKNAFFAPRIDDFTDLDDTNRRLEAWVRDTANTRVHGTTGQRPVEVFESTEQPALRGLPDTPYVPVLWHRTTVGRNAHVAFQGRFYSAPWGHLGKEAWLKVSGNCVSIYVDDAHVADHRRRGSTPWSTVEAHLPEGRRDFAQRDPAHWYARADAMGEEVGVYVRAVMASDEVHYPLRRVQSIVRTLEGAPEGRAQSIARRASRFACYRPDAVKKILADGLDLDPEPGGFVDPGWAEEPRFARQATDFLQTWEADHG